MTPPPGLSFGVGFALSIGLSQPEFVLEPHPDAPSNLSNPSPISSSHHPSSERESTSSTQSDPSNPTSPAQSDKAGASDAPMGVAQNNAQNQRNVRAFWQETRASEDELSRVVFDSLFDPLGRVRVDWITSGEWLGAYADAEQEMLDQAGDEYALNEEDARLREEEEYHAQHGSDGSDGEGQLASIDDDDDDDDDDAPVSERDDDSESASASASPYLPPTPDLYLEPHDPKRLFAAILPIHAHTLQRKRRPSLDVFLDDEDDTSGSPRPFFGIAQRPFWLKAPPGDLYVTTKSPTSPVDKSRDTSAQFTLPVQAGTAAKGKKAVKGKGRAKRVRWAEPESASIVEDRLTADSKELEDAGGSLEAAEVPTGGPTERTRKRTKRR